MWTLINSPETYPFGAALLLMLLIGLVELLSVFTSGFTQSLDALLPESLLESSPPDVKLPLDQMNAGFKLLDWLFVGRVPLMMLLVMALAVFGAVGLVLQNVFYSVSGSFLNVYLAMALVAMLSLPILRLCAAVWYRIMPKDETSAVNEDALIGRVGVVVLGVASATQSAEIRVKDTHGQTHYIMAQSDDQRDLPQNTRVLVVSRQGHIYKIIENVNANLLD